MSIPRGMDRIFIEQGPVVGIKPRAKTMHRHEAGLTTDPAHPDADISQHASVVSRAQTDSR